MMLQIRSQIHVLQFFQKSRHSKGFALFKEPQKGLAPQPWTLFIRQ